MLYFFFFKQKTAYEMRISDWSSDVCSSDLIERLIGTMIGKLRLLPGATGSNVAARDGYDAEADAAMTLVEFERWLLCQIAIYHHAPHSALGGLCPAQMWERRSEEHTSELQSLMRISYAVFCLQTNKTCI